MAATALSELQGGQPLVNVGVARVLRAAAVLADTNWVFAPATGDRVNVADARRIALYVTIDGGGGDAAQDVRIVPLLSAEETMPAAGDDSWYPPMVSDGTVTAEPLGGGTLPTGADWTKTPEWGKVVSRPLTLVGETLDNATDKMRGIYVIDVTHARWFQLVIADVSAAATKATVGVRYVLGV